MCGESTVSSMRCHLAIAELCVCVQQSCDKPFENPAFFQRDGKPFCERCFSIMIRNEI